MRKFNSVAVLFLAMFFTLPTTLFSQGTYVVVDSILIEGNDKTKGRIITREMTFKVGDTLSLANLNEVLEDNRLRILNTSLFVRASVEMVEFSDNNHAKARIKVKEAWYIYPVPIFEISDRNFNVWWVEHHHTLDRINYGLRTTYNNATGNRDNLRFNIQGGYTPRFSVGYDFPYLDKKQEWGAGISLGYGVNHDISYTTVQNKVLILKQGDSVQQRIWGVDFNIGFHRGLHWSQGLSYSFSQFQINDIVAKDLNPDYFLKGQTLQKYSTITYGIAYDTRNIRQFTTKGRLVQFTVAKLGVFTDDNVNKFLIDLRWAEYFQIAPKWSLSTIAKARRDLTREKQPYNQNHIMGFGGDYLTGYEYYVMDGLDMAYMKNSLAYQLFNTEIKIASFTKKIPFLKLFKSVPFKLYVSANLDYGYVNDAYYGTNNPLTNKFLYSGGLGVDILAYNDTRWQFNYSITQQGESGLFIHFRSNF
jgi:outer membrane protein assembly factor BamA